MARPETRPVSEPRVRAAAARQAVRDGTAAGVILRMRARARPGLRAHLLALVLAVALPALLFGAIAIGKVAESYDAAARARLEATARNVALALDKALETRIAALTALASSPLLDEPELTAFDAQAREVAQALGSRIVLLDADLQQLVNTGLPENAALPRGASAGPGAQVLASGRPIVSDLFTARSTGKPAIAVLVPVTRNGRAVKVLSTALGLGSLEVVLSELELPGGRFVILTDSHKHVVARYPDGADAVGQPAPAWHNEALPGLLPSGVALVTTPEERELALAARRLVRARWTATVAEPLEVYQESWRQPLAGLVLAGLVLLALAGAAAILLARCLLGPMEALTRQARAVTAGGTVGAVPAAPLAEFEVLRAALAESEAALRGQAEAERAAARAVRDSEARLRAVLEQMPVGVALVEAPSGRLLLRNARALQILGEGQDRGGETVEDPLARATGADGAPLDPHERPLVRALRDGETVDGLELLHRRPDGAATRLEVSAAPIRDEAGAVVLAVGTFSSIDARKEAEEQQRLLTAELSHRVKNTLAVVQALMSQTLARSRSLPEFRAVYEGRLHALARAHDLLLRTAWRHIDLAALVESELGLFAQEAGRIEARGGPLPLGPRKGLALGLILHELVSNAARHGSLAGAKGRVEIAWIEENGQVRLRWQEQGGPAVPAAPAPGFGVELIRRSASYDLGGRAEYNFFPEGVRWIVIFPL
jgi:PAS domain S-box-containing protein